MNKHSIQKLVLDFQLAPQEPYQRQMAALRTYWRQYLEPVIDQLLDGFTEADLTIGIDRLEVDLGKVRWPLDGEELKRQLYTELKETLETGRPAEVNERKYKIEKIAPTVFRLRVFRHFLCTGQLPWASKKAAEESWDEWVTPLLEEKPGPLRQTLLEALREEKSMRRMVYQLSPELIRQLVSFLVPEAGKRITGLRRHFDRVIQLVSETKRLKSITSAADPFYFVLFRAIRSVVDAPSQTVEKVFLRYLVETTAAETGRGGEELRRSLIARLRTEKSDQHSAQLLAGLMELSASAHLPDRKERENNTGSSRNADLEMRPSLQEIKDKWAASATPPGAKGYNGSGESHRQKSGSDRNEFPQPQERETPDHLDNTPVVKQEWGYPEETGEGTPSLKALLSGEGLYLSQAGLVLLHPFLKNLFEALGWWGAQGFAEPAARIKAVHLLYFLGCGQTEPPEETLLMHKLLAGWPLEEPVPRCVPLAPAETAEAENMLRVAIRHWEALKDTTPDGLREGFLKRPGKLVEDEVGGYQLIVEKATHDILLKWLPWGIGMIKLPWMEEVVRVEWGR